MKPRQVSELIAAVRLGNEAAIDQLLGQVEPWLFVLARSRIESRFAAKFESADVVQQTLVQAARDLGDFRGASEAEFLAWIRRILAHVLAHEIRRYAGTQMRDLDCEVSLDRDLTSVSHRLGDLLPGEGPTPSQGAIKTDRQLQLARLLARLSADDREVLVLRHVEGMAYEEIARRMNRQPGAVRMLWVRALARLRQEIASDSAESF